MCAAGERSKGGPVCCWDEGLELLCFLYIVRSKYELSKLLWISWRETKERKSSTSLLDLTACTPCIHCPSAKLRQYRGPRGLKKTAPLTKSIWVLFVSGQGCAGLSKGQAHLLDLNLTFWLCCRISAGLGYPAARSKMSLRSSARELQRAVPKATGGQGKNRSCFFGRNHQQHMHNAGRVEEPSPLCCVQPHQPAEQIAAVYVLKICRCMRHRPQIPKYLIVLANEAAQYLSACNLQVPLIFPTVWCLVLTAGERVVNRRAHLQV